MKQLKVAFVMFGFFCIFLFCIVMLNGCGGGGSSSSSGGASASSNSNPPAKSLSPTKEITTFVLNTGSGIGTPGVITDHGIVVTVPFATPLSNLVASFTTTGVKVMANGVSQISGQMVNNFSTPLSYEVVAANGTSKVYAVTVTRASISAKEITAFSLRSATNTSVYSGTIIGNDINVVVPSTTDLSTLIATFTTSGRDVMVSGDFQDNGITSNNFTIPVVYTVIDANGMTKTYTVTATTASTSATEISKFSLNGTLSDTITGKNINVVMPFGTDLSSLVANYTTTGSYVSVDGVIQDNGLVSNDFSKGPVIYTVTAPDGISVAKYTVTATIALNTAKDITRFSLNGVNGTISDHNILVQLPSGTDLTSLTAEFATTGENVSVSGSIQTSAHTTNDFSNGPVTYVVTAMDGSVANYIVTATN